MTEEGRNDNINQSMRALLRKSQRETQPLGTPPAQNAQEGASAPQDAMKLDVSAHMRGMLHKTQERGGTLPDTGMVAFHLAARRLGAKNPAALYQAAQDRVTVDLAGNVHGDMDALMADLKRENPAAFFRFTIDAGAGIGNATGDARTPNPAQGSDLARASLDIGRRFRQD